MKRDTFWRILVAVGLVGILGVFSACAPATQAPQPTATGLPATAKPAAAPTVAPPTPKPAPFTVKLSQVSTSLSDSALIIADAKGYFAEQGLTIDRVVHTSGAEVIGSLSTGELDVAGGGWSLAHANALQRGITFKVVADKMSKQQGFTAYRVSMRKDLYDSGQLKDIAQLKGKKIAVSSAAAMGSLLAPTLKQANLTVKDVELVALGFPYMVAALTNKSVDAVVLAEPILSTAVDMGLAVRGPDLFNVDPAPSAGAVYFSSKFAENVDAANRFVLAYVKALRDYNDAFLKNKGRSEIAGILAKSMEITNLALFDKMDMPGLNPDGLVDTKALAGGVQYWLSTGELKENLDVDKVVDNRFVENALRVLGKYAR